MTGGRHRFGGLGIRALAVAAAISVVAASIALAAAAGDLDTTFSSDGKRAFDVFGNKRDEANAMAIQADGKIVVGGQWYGTAGDGSTATFALARFMPSGALDTSFGSGGRTLTTFPNGPAAVTGIAIAPDGKIIAAGWRDDDDGSNDGDFAVARYTSGGDRDTTFSGDGKTITSFGASDRADAVALQADGKVVVVGRHKDGPDYDFAFARFKTNGALDAAFAEDGRRVVGFGGNDSGYAVAIQADGKIVAAGERSALDVFERDFALARLRTDGSLDSGFAGDGKLTASFGSLSDYDSARAVAIQSNGRIVVGGQGGSDASDFALLRLTTSGSPDNSFSSNGFQTAAFPPGSSRINALAIQANGRIVAVGERAFKDRRFALARFTTGGNLDTSFSGDGKQTTSFTGHDRATGAALQSDGKIVAAGTADPNQSAPNFAITRYHAVAN
jgi:uncharacterized delta-60 repeat protein